MYQFPAFRAGIRCGNIREEERCCRRNTGSKREEKEPDLGYVVMRLVRKLFLGRLHGQATDHRTVQAQIGQFTVGQFRKLIHRLAIDAIPCEPGFCSFEQRSQPGYRCAFKRGVMCCYSHLRDPVFCVAASVFRRLLETENKQMLQLHNS